MFSRADNLLSSLSPLLCWRLFWLIGFLLCALAFGFHFFSDNFSYAYRVREMPIPTLVFGLFLTGLLFVFLRFLLPRLVKFEENAVFSLRFLTVSPLCAIFVIGLLARALLLFSEPVLEDDYHRYLWDGGVLAHGVSPYKYSPTDILEGEDTPMLLKELSSWASPVPERINHPDLRTIYPAGAQALFSVSHFFGPWSLTAWRIMILMAELTTFALLLSMLNLIARSPLWISLYWWNPLVIKELMNSAHMEAVMLPFLLGGVYLAMRGFFAKSSLLLSLAASIKFWPALLLPLVWQPLLKRPLILVISIVISLCIGGVIVWPFLQSGLNESSGLVAYGVKWKTNSAFFPTFESLILFFTDLVSLPQKNGALLARALVGLFLVGLVFWLAFAQIKGDKKHERLTLFSFSVVSFALFLLSPAQFPWYFVWVAPFLVFYPLWGFVVLMPFMAFYYLGFYFNTLDEIRDYKFLLSFLIWLPVWGLLAYELLNHRRRLLAPV